MGKARSIRLQYFDGKKAIFEARVYSRRITGPYREANITVPAIISQEFLNKTVKVTMEVLHESRSLSTERNE